MSGLQAVAKRVDEGPEPGKPIHPSELAITVRIENGGPDAVKLVEREMQYASLALEVEDECGKAVPFPPPPPPHKGHPHGTAPPAAPASIDPGSHLDLRYAGFLDSHLPSGTYRVRYRGRGPSLGGTPAEPLLSNWVEVKVQGHGHGWMGPIAPPDPQRWPRIPEPDRVPHTWWDRIIDWIRGLWPGARRCRCCRTTVGNVSTYQMQEISDATSAYAHRNDCYQWPVRCRVSLEEKACRAVIRVRIAWKRDPALPASYDIQGYLDGAKANIAAKWSNVLKFCAENPCCKGGHEIEIDLQLFEFSTTIPCDYVVTIGASAMDMRYWSVNEPSNVPHEFGHMLGACDEYYTVRCGSCGSGGTPYGAPAEPGNVMNHVMGAAEPHHLSFLAQAVASQVLESWVGTQASGQPCESIRAS